MSTGILRYHTTGENTLRTSLQLFGIFIQLIIKKHDFPSKIFRRKISLASKRDVITRPYLQYRLIKNDTTI